MEASKIGRAQQHVDELVSQYNDAVAKLNMLKSLTPDTVQLLASIYNESVSPTDQKKSSQPASTNVFATSNSVSTQPTQTQQNPFQMGNIFGGNQPQQSTMNAGSIFGGAAATNNPFQSSQQNSIFGGGMKEQPQSTASNFTFALSQPAPQQSMFSAAAQSSPQSSMFGAAQPAQQMPTSSIFGGGQTNTFGSMFAAPAQQPQPQLQQQQLQQQTSMPFGSSMFAPSQQVPPSTTLFSQAQQVPGSFGQAQQAPAFQQATGNVFSQFQAQSPPQQPNNANMFTQSAALPTQNVFGVQQAPPQQVPSAPSGSIFQIQQPLTNQPQQSFGANPFQSKPPPIDDSAYSKPEDLTPDEMQEFQSESFTLGKIPLKPPPKHLCM